MENLDVSNRLAIQRGNSIASAWFSDVFRGQLREDSGNYVSVAIKRLKIKRGNAKGMQVNDH